MGHYDAVQSLRKGCDDASSSSMAGASVYAVAFVKCDDDEDPAIGTSVSHVEDKQVSSGVPLPPKPREGFRRRRHLQHDGQSSGAAQSQRGICVGGLESEWTVGDFSQKRALHSGLESGDANGECKYWLRKGVCWRGDECGWPHAPEFKAVAPVKSGPMHAPIRHVRNKWRASIFRRWLLDTFGVEMLKRGSGILDVAGGQGELSFELLNLNGVSSTIIDPRQGWNIDKAIRLLEAGQYHSTDALLRHVSVPLDECRRLGPRIPRHERMFLDPRLWIGDEVARSSAYEHLVRRALKLVWRPRGLVANESAQSGGQDVAAGPTTSPIPPDVASTTSFADLQELLMDSSLVVGMHPDQAAGAIVEFAVYHRKPYALVPCCTFAKEFPRRRLASGQPVRSYEELIEWLREVDPDAVADYLDFEGRNIVIYNRFLEN